MSKLPKNRFARRGSQQPAAIAKDLGLNFERDAKTPAYNKSTSHMDEFPPLTNIEVNSIPHGTTLSTSTSICNFFG